jgi:hypothetical protein
MERFNYRKIVAREQGVMAGQALKRANLKRQDVSVYTTPDSLRRMTIGRALALLALLTVAIGLAGCSFGRATPTRTPFPTWTPTAEGQQPAGDGASAAVPTATSAPVVALPTNPPESAPPTPEPLAAASATPEPLPTETPTDIPTEPPAATPTPEPTATAPYAFVLEAAEKFPTDSLAANVVRIDLYVYAATTYGLPGYTLQVLHNGNPLTVDEETTGGVPEQTRDTPGPSTRFTNMSVVFVEPQAGRWELQLLDSSRTPVGPPVTFDLTADEITRELYVRYRQE